MKRYYDFCASLIGTCLITTIVLFIYWTGLQSGLMLDDGPQILPIVHEINDENWTKSYKDFIFSNSGQLGRPISMISFIFNAVLAGDNIWYWKFTNVILHLLCGLSFFYLTRLILTFNSKNSNHSINIISIGITVIWLVHPLHVSTVLYLTQRMSILATLFIINALYFYFKAVQNEINNKTGAPQLFLSVLLFLPLALLSKENSTLFPIYILLSTVYISKTTLCPIRKLPNRIIIYNQLIILMIIIGTILLIKYHSTLITNGYDSRPFTLSERILTQSRVIILYLSQIMIPLPSLMGFYHDDIIISKSILSPYTTFLSISFLLFLITFILVNFNKTPLLSFGLLFFFSSHLIESSIFPLEIAFEHRNYIGIWGVLLSSSYILRIIRLDKFYFIILICLFLSGLTFNRSKMWSDPGLMYPYMLSIHPDSRRLHIIFADTYASSGNYEKALDYLAQDEGFGVELQRLSIICNQFGKLESGILPNLINNKSNIKIGTYEMEGIIRLSNLGLDNKCSFSKKEFIDFLSTIIASKKLNKSDAQKTIIYLAHYYHAIGNVTNAIIALEDSHSKDKSNPIPLFLMTEWLIDTGKPNEAKKAFKRAEIISNNSLYNYNEFIIRIRPMLSNSP